jgi:hypothetical protein
MGRSITTIILSLPALWRENRNEINYSNVADSICIPKDKAWRIRLIPDFGQGKPLTGR